MTDVALSDHYCVFFEITNSVDNSRIKTEVIRKFCINRNTCTLFTQAFVHLLALPSVSVNDHVDSFCSINTIASIKIKVVFG